MSVNVTREMVSLAGSQPSRVWAPGYAKDYETGSISPEGKTDVMIPF